MKTLVPLLLLLTKQVRATYISNDSFFSNRWSYSCEGLSPSGSGAGPPPGLEEIVIKFDYDIHLAVGIQLDNAMLTLESTLLKYVGDEIFRDCEAANALSIGGSLRRLTASYEIEEIQTEPKDTPYDSEVKCDGEHPENEARPLECYPVAGYMTAYYRSSGNKENDALAVDQMINAIVEEGMGGETLKTKGIRSVNYVGARGIPQSLPLALATEDEQRQNDDLPWYQESQWIIVGAVGGFVALVLGVLVIKRFRSRKSKVNQNKSQEEDKTDHAPYSEAMKKGELKAEETGEKTKENEEYDNQSAIVPRWCDDMFCRN